MAVIDISFNSKVLNSEESVKVIMPQGRGGYKVLYLLHGVGGDCSSWITRTRIAEYADYKNLVVVMPSGKNSCYVDSPYGRKYFTYITEELPGVIGQWFKVSKKREDIFIAGMSLGGYGAVNAFLERPDIYKACFSYSGLLDIKERYKKPKGLDIKHIFGDEAQFEAGDYDLMKKVEDFNKSTVKNKEYVDNSPLIYLNCGNQDQLINMTLDMYKHCCDNNISARLSTGDGGHDFNYWDGCIKETIDIICAG